MHLPPPESTHLDPFLYQCFLDDQSGFLSPSFSTNRSFESKRRVQASADLLIKFLPPPPIPLADIGCGQANLGLFLADQGYQVDLIDHQVKFFDYIKLKTNSKNVNYVSQDLGSKRSAEKKYFGIYFGEALEHMSDPLHTLKELSKMLKVGGVLCLTTPNGDYIDCSEKKWSEVKDQPERNLKLANSPGSHVCEFTQKELVSLVKDAGLNILGHELILSKRASRAHLLRRLVPHSVFTRLDKIWAKQIRNGASLAKTQVLIARKTND
jgi:2-polyprenyl-3-methyl-5-hydroxy-6-metoxy-1,4-benzoquinol methylase